MLHMVYDWRVVCKEHGAGSLSILSCTNASSLPIHMALLVSPSEAPTLESTKLL